MGRKLKSGPEGPFRCFNPAVRKAGAGPCAGKPTPSANVKEKAANQLNTNWNLFPSSLFPVTRGTHSTLKYSLGLSWHTALL